MKTLCEAPAGCQILEIPADSLLLDICEVQLLKSYILMPEQNLTSHPKTRKSINTTITTTNKYKSSSFGERLMPVDHLSLIPSLRFHSIRSYLT